MDRRGQVALVNVAESCLADVQRDGNPAVEFISEQEPSRPGAERGGRLYEQAVGGAGEVERKFIAHPPGAATNVADVPAGHGGAACPCSGEASDMAVEEPGVAVTFASIFISYIRAAVDRLSAGE